jgi:hypothetical protein
MGKAKKTPDPGFVGGKGILALLDEEHPVPKGGWTATVLARACNLSPATVLHHLERLRGWAQVTSASSSRQIEFRRANDDPGRPPRTIEVRTLIWEITPKGAKRLELRGGHEAHCPVCRKAKTKGTFRGKAAANPEE